MMDQVMMEKSQTVARDRREKVAAILGEIDKNKKFKDITQAYDSKQFKMVRFAGHIGPDVTFTKEHHEYDFNVNATCVDLAYKGADLGHIVIKQEITHHHSIDFNRRWYLAIKTDFDATEISVVSPAWEEGQGAITKTKETAMKINKVFCNFAYDTKKRVIKLNVYHAENETADAVLERMSIAIAKSKDKAVVAKKLRHLNLPSKVAVKNKDALADNIVNQIHSTDREM